MTDKPATQTDIVARARDICVGSALAVACERDDLCQEMASEIERLRAILTEIAARSGIDRGADWAASQAKGALAHGN